METKFNFNSQVCSSLEQSRRLLALGLKKKTADMVWLDYSLYPDVEDWRICADYEDWGTWQEGGIPAWSLHRIWVLMPKWIDTDKRRYYLQMNAKGDIGYFSDNYHALEYFYGNETIYDDCISCIEWLIKEGYFNKEYLV